MKWLSFGLVTVALLSSIGCANEEGTMRPTITSGKQVAEHADLGGSSFHDVNLAGAQFDDVNLSGAVIHNVNLSDISVSAVQIGGAKLRYVGLPPDRPDQQSRQRPVSFEEATLCDSTFHKVDLSNVRITECNIEGMTIDGMLVTDLIAAYKRQK